MIAVFCYQINAQVSKKLLTQCSDKSDPLSMYLSPIMKFPVLFTARIMTWVELDLPTWMKLLLGLKLELSSEG